MPEEIAAPMESFAEAPAGEKWSDGKTIRWFELCLVLLLCFSSSTISSLYILRNGMPQALSQIGSSWGYKTFHELVGLFLLGYVLWRRKLRFRDLGLRWSWRDLPVGILLFVVAMVVYSQGHRLILLLFHQTRLEAATATWTTAHQMFGHPSFMTIPFILLNPLFEELIVRAYLMTEIRALTGSWLLAGTVSVAIQASYHLYYGWVGALSVALYFVVFSTYYGIRRRATPIVIAHGIIDVLAIIRLWHL